MSKLNAKEYKRFEEIKRVHEEILVKTVVIR